MPSSLLQQKPNQNFAPVVGTHSEQADGLITPPPEPSRDYYDRFEAEYVDNFEEEGYDEDHYEWLVDDHNEQLAGC